MSSPSKENLPDFETVYVDLLSWCRSHDFAGYDPFDGLNSRLLQHIQLGRSRSLRLLWTQLVKRSPLNPRRLLAIPAQRNAKGIALFALAALATHRRVGTSETERQARQLLQSLLDMRIEGYSGAAWGYNFDWQSRHFLAPAGSPTIVPTAFAARALIEAAEALKDKTYLQAARSVCDFITKDLPTHTDADGGICFSYSPTSATQVFNASLLAAETLARVGNITGERDLCDLADQAATYVVRRQKSDGSWTYGAHPSQSWTDNFHTAFVLYSLKNIVEACGTNSATEEALERGYEFWRQRFFVADGWPKYYDDSLYPADVHAAATAIITLLEFREIDSDALVLAETVARWTIKNLRSSDGFFYYQRTRFWTIKTPFMRWTQAWMLYALARLIEVKQKPEVFTDLHHEKEIHAYRS